MVGKVAAGKVVAGKVAVGKVEDGPEAAVPRGCTLCGPTGR